MRLQVAWYPRSAIHQNALEPRDIDVPNLAGLRTERRQGMLWVRAVPQQCPQDPAIRREVHKLDADQLKQTLLETLGRFQCRFDLGLHFRAGPPVVVHDDGVLGWVVVISRSSGDAGLVRDVP